MRFGTLYFLLALTHAWPGTQVLAAQPEVHVVRNGQATTVSRPEHLVAKLSALAESSSVSSTAYAAALATWKQLLASESHVRVLFPEPRILSLKLHNGQAQQPLRIHGLLLPLPTGQWPAHVFVNTGTNLISLTKFSPLALKELVQEPDLQLSTVKPYTSLLPITQGGK
jgi:hypothetical protein